MLWSLHAKARVNAGAVEGIVGVNEYYSAIAHLGVPGIEICPVVAEYADVE